MKSTEIKTDTCIVSKDKNGIIHKTVKPKAHLDAYHIKESDEIGFKLAGGKKALILYDARPTFTLTHSGMEYLHKHLLSKNRIASAIVSDKPGIKLLGDYFKNSKPGSPQIKVFKTMKEAMAWLITFKDGGRGVTKEELRNIYIKPKKKPTAVKIPEQVKPKEPIHGSITTCIAQVEVDKNNIAYKRILRDAHVDLPSLQKSFKETIGFLGQEKRLMLYDLRPHFTITDDALEFVVDEIMGRHGVATAVLAKTIG
ncbi:MAG TPA: hypothetical protein VNY36_03710, partial [Bacteroidia bacterium]|nr:hypothetical protein [Bacteroidia bacterium]